MCRWADTRHCHTGKAKQPGRTRRSQRPPQQHPRTGAATIASPIMRCETGRARCCHGIHRCRGGRTCPGSSERYSACHADVRATRPHVPMRGTPNACLTKPTRMMGPRSFGGTSESCWSLQRCHAMTTHTPTLRTSCGAKRHANGHRRPRPAARSMPWPEGALTRAGRATHVAMNMARIELAMSSVLAAIKVTRPHVPRQGRTRALRSLMNVGQLLDHA